MSTALNATDPAGYGVRMAKPFRHVAFVSVQTLEEQAMTPPPGCRRMFLFVPMYVDGRVCVLDRAARDTFPTADTMVYREPCGEGTAYWLAPYGLAWPMDKRDKAPLLYKNGGVLWLN